MRRTRKDLTDATSVEADARVTGREDSRTREAAGLAREAARASRDATVGGHRR